MHSKNGHDGDYDFESIRSFYQSEIEPYFGFLVEGYGFSVEGLSDEQNPQFFEKLICFANGGVCIGVLIGIWCISGVSVGRVRDGQCSLLFSLDSLIRRRAPKRLVKHKPGNKLDLQNYADFLQADCQDLLSGDVRALLRKRS